MGKGSTPGAPAVYAPPAPPTAANAAAVEASADARQKAEEEQGITSTILGGQAASGGTGDLMNPKNGAGFAKNSLLGGG